MKNQYEIKQSYIIELENEELRKRIKELIVQINELKKINEIREVVQGEGNNTIIEK